MIQIQMNPTIIRPITRRDKHANGIDSLLFENRKHRGDGKSGGRGSEGRRP